MGLQQSKGALVYEQVNYGNVDGIRALRREGAELEWIDKEGKTPLILACMRPELLRVAGVLIELGANVNAYRPGSHAGTPLHHAAKRGLAQTIELLLIHGANPLVMNDDCQTALDLARTKGHWNVVRLIESRICLFAGWLREANWPSMLEAIVRQWVSKKIWVVILPCDSRSPTQRKFELAIYPELQAAQPRAVIGLWKVHIEEPTFNQPDPTLVMVDKAKKTRYKFLSEYEGDKQQLRQFYDACRGLPQLNHSIPGLPAVNHSIPALPAGTAMPNTSQHHPHAPAAPAAIPPKSAPDDVELAMAINASIQSAIAEGVTLPGAHSASEASSSFNGWDAITFEDCGPPPSKASSTHARLDGPTADPYNGWTVPDATQPKVGPSGAASPPHASQDGASAIAASAPEAPHTASLPSAPPIVDEVFYCGPIHYPPIDSSPVDLTVPALGGEPGTSEGKEGSSSMSGSCVICLDAPAEGACIPCGHVAGCMSCLGEIKKKKWGCPVCRADIDQVIKLYAV